MQKTKILIFNQYFVPGFKGGGPIVSVYNLAMLLRKEYDVYVFCRNRDGLTTIAYDNITSDDWSVINGGINVFYASDASLNVAFAQRVIEDVRPDYIYLNSLFNPRFTIDQIRAIQKARFPLNKVVINPRGELNEGALAIKPLKKKVFIALLKFSGLYRKVIWNATNLKEENRIIKVFPGSTVNVLPNIPRQDVLARKDQAAKKYNRFVFLSRIDRIKNIEQFLHVLKNITEPVVFDIYGPVANDDYWEACKKEIALLPDAVKVKYQGEVNPQNVLDTLANYDYFVLPSRGENFGHAIMDAVSAGLPVLISTNTPWSDFGISQCGFDVAIEDESAWQKATQAMLAASQEQYAKWCNNALTLARQKADDPAYLQQARSLFPHQNS